nr:hypothetical protein [Vibrio vulnificus]
MALSVCVGFSGYGTVR